MAKKRYSDERAKKVIKAFNAAVRRASKSSKLTDLEKMNLPQKLNFKTVSQMTSQADRDRLLDYLSAAKGGVKNFKAVDLGKGVKATPYSLKVAEMQIKNINRDRAARRREYRREGIDTSGIDVYKKQSFDPKSYTSQHGLDKRLWNLSRQATSGYINWRQSIYMDNYEKALKHNYGEDVGGRIFEKIKNSITNSSGEAASMTPDDFEKVMAKNKNLEIGYMYTDHELGNADKYLDMMSSAFDIDLSDFVELDPDEELPEDWE